MACVVGRQAGQAGCGWLDCWVSGASTVGRHPGSLPSRRQGGEFRPTGDVLGDWRALTVTTYPGDQGGRWQGTDDPRAAPAPYDRSAVSRQQKRVTEE